ncbi:uncharacterized protein LOC117174594 [Belonocnema kinseyi]|uniref:uncharacterized protein LOC117174594 n=1 Tax=Belonocnema kinseyi TaxID=2817044 RepID=UPI00143DF659|nr:uncharacterized protein LOC117174594 [Belonocnema kinseyi]
MNSTTILTADIKKKIFELAEKYSSGVFRVVRRGFRLDSDDTVLSKLQMRINHHFWSIYKNPAIYHAISTGSSILLELLILIGTKMSTESCRGENPLDLAIKLGNDSLVKILTENQNSMRVRKGHYNELQFALTCRNVENVKKLLSKTYSGTVFTEDIDIVKFLLDKDDEVIIERSKFSTLLYFAARIENDDALELVLSKSSTSNINAVGPHEGSLLKLLIKNDNVKMINLLLENGVDLNSEVGVDQLKYAIEKDIYLGTIKSRIMETFVAALAKMIENQEYVSKRTRDCIFQNERVRHYYEKCAIEIRRMKEEKIRGYDRICLYDILTRNLEKLASLARNKTAFKRLNLKKYEKMFPIYRNEIKRNNERAIWRLEEIERLIKTFQYRVKLPAMIFYQIFGYLNDIELKNSVHYFSLVVNFFAQKY